MTAGYRARIYFDSASEGSLKEYRASIALSDATLKELVAFNERISGKLTTNFLKEFGAEYGNFQKYVEETIELVQNMGKTKAEVVLASTKARSLLKTLNATMSQTLTNYLQTLLFKFEGSK